MTDQTCVPKTAFLPAGIDACGMYRMFIPHLAVPNSMFLFRYDRLDIKQIQDQEVIIVQRQATPQNFKALQTMKKYGKKIIYDLDDNMWSIPESNPGAKYIKPMREGFSVCAKEADVLTVSTQGLKTAVTTEMPNLNKPILVVPNGINFHWMIPSGLEKDDGHVIVGWAGSNTHSEDVREAWSVLPRLLDKYEQVGMEFIGEDPPKGLERHPRVRIKNWVPIGEYANRFSGWSWDISLAPLVDCRFNRSKSALKAIEAGAVKIPCLMSDVQPFQEFCSLGGTELKWLLCSSRKQWSDKLEKLIVDEPFRKHLGEKMYEVSKKWFDIDVLKDNWIHAIRMAKEC